MWATEIHSALAGRGLTPAYWEIEGDGRKIVWAMVEGRALPLDTDKIPTVILLGHLDVAGVQDYSADVDPFDPQALHDVPLEQYEKNPDTEDERLLDAGSRQWMFGRGSFDMKSGVAAQIAVMGALTRSRDTLPGNVIMIVTPDEEVESAGTMAAVERLVELGTTHHLDYVGVINSDYTAPREPGDDNRYIYRGTVGKMLCCFYVRGRETHVGEAFRGLDANLIASSLIQETNLNVALCDEADGEITSPPLTQKQRDFKARYDAQTPISVVIIHCSCLVHSWPPRMSWSRWSPWPSALSARLTTDGSSNGASTPGFRTAPRLLRTWAGRCGPISNSTKLSRKRWAAPNWNGNWKSEPLDTS